MFYMIHDNIMQFEIQLFHLKRLTMANASSQPSYFLLPFFANGNDMYVHQTNYRLT